MLTGLLALLAKLMLLMLLLECAALDAVGDSHQVDPAVVKFNWLNCWAACCSWTLSCGGTVMGGGASSTSTGQAWEPAAAARLAICCCAALAAFRALAGFAIELSALNPGRIWLLSAASAVAMACCCCSSTLTEELAPLEPW
jgi:hypothetical protein